MKLHTKDVKILSELQHDARQSYSTIAKKVGMSKQLVRYRIQILQKKKIISRFIAVIDTHRLGYTFYNVAYQLKKSSQARELAFINAITQAKEVHWGISTIGKWNIVVAFLVKNVTELLECTKVIEQQFHDIIEEKSMFIVANATQLGYNYLTPSVCRELGGGDVVSLDPLDHSLLFALKQQPTASYLELSQAINASYETVKSHYLHLQTMGVMKGCSLKLNPSAFGYEWHVVMMQMIVSNTDLYSYLKNQNNIVYMINAIGQWNMLLDVHVKGQRELQSILEDIQEKFPGSIRTYETLLVTEEHKCHFLEG